MAAKKSAAKKPASKGTKPAAKTGAGKAAPKRMGRPPKRASERKSSNVLVRVTDVQKDTMQRAAKAAGTDLSTYVLEATMARITSDTKSR